MWVLETATLKLHFFPSPEKVPGGYAILSHTWDAKEQSFQQLQQINRRFILDKVRRKLVSPKIRNFCDLARREGYKWGWVDTCCIDKTSSAELSEAINSMFRYYTLSHVCYAYLSDVPLQGRLNGTAVRLSPFASSRWHTRGWTLQELIAPRVVFFLSKSWEFMGSKAELAELLHETTRIPASILRLEIMKHSSDTTLFAWGDWLGIPGDDPVEPSSLFASGPGDFCQSYNIYHTPRVHEQPLINLDNSRGNEYLITFDITPYGVQAHIPVINIQGHPCADLGWTYGRPNSKNHGRLLLSLKDDPQSSSTRSRYTIFAFANITSYNMLLSPCRMVKVALDDKVFWKLIDICKDPESPSIRTTDLTPPLYLYPYPFGGVYTIHAMWQEVYLRDISQLAPSLREEMPMYIPINHTRLPPIRIPEHLIARVKARLAHDNTNPSCMKVINGSPPWTGDYPMSIELLNWTFKPWRSDLHSGYGHIRLVLGRCTSVTKLTSEVPPAERKGPVSLWVYIASGQWYAPEDHIVRELEVMRPGHQCPDDHILSWPGMKKSFEVLTPRYTATLTLVFTLRNSPTLTLKKTSVTLTERHRSRWM
ncbi:heterokaryon incompatibility protein-domain-containing protein [Earliella scabrosa]|nr:heterokaryon incompatibility protein-domain-containing protein [Earliella scabrosa]